MNFLHHWFYQDLWLPVWPNWFAGAVVAPIAFLWGKAFERRAIKRHHEHMAKLDRLHGKIDAVHRHLKIKEK